MSEQRPESKIIVDSDWKSQAQAEKERLAAAEREKAAKERPRPSAQTTAPAGVAGNAPGEEELPEPNFKALLGTLITNALMYMGAFPDPQTGRAMVAPEYARFHIDLISVLQEKTKGNLSPEDAKDIEQALGELRMQFVELMRAVTAMAMKQKTQGGDAILGGGGGGVDPLQAAQKLRGG